MHILTPTKWNNSLKPSYVVENILKPCWLEDTERKTYSIFSNFYFSTFKKKKKKQQKNTEKVFGQKGFSSILAYSKPSVTRRHQLFYILAS